MIKLKGIVPVLIGMLIFNACESKKEKKEEKAENLNNFVIEGNIENGRGTVIMLGRIGQRAEILATDTADANGNFHLEGFAREKFVAIFNFDQYKKIFLVVDTTDRIELQVPDKNYDEYSVKGSEESQIFRRLRDIEVRSGKELGQIRERAELIDPEDEAKLNILREEFTAVNNKYIQEYSDSLKDVHSPLVKLYYNLVLQVPFTDSMKAELYEEANASGLQGELVQSFVKTYRSQLATAVGQMAPEINLPDTSGQAIGLSSLRGKVVLIDFWASWCGPCRQENPNVVNLYEKYKDKGFEIYGVSLDKEEGKWKEAIHQDGIHWVHVSDLQEWRSAAASLYAVTSIPSTFLIDRDGKIIAKDLRGKALADKMEEVLN